jgi:hypothetical protein
MSRSPWLWTAAALMLVGCGGDADMLAVSGTVKYADGTSPQGETARIVFQPTAQGRPATATLGGDGSFELMTQTPGDGALPGHYKVVLEIWKSYRDQESVIPPEYGDAATTPLEATVDAEHTEFEFTVEK